MPRAFLITRHRFNSIDCSPERKIRMVEYGNGHQQMSDGASECGSESSSECPEELYNLTKLAEVSLAAAAGTLVHPTNSINQTSTSQLFFGNIGSECQDLLELKSRRISDKTLLEATRYAVQLESHDNSSMKTTMTVTTTVASTDSISSNLNHRIEQQDGNEEHECVDCGKKYSTSSNLARHRQTHRSLGDKKARRCPHCNKVYVSIPAFSMHVRTHNQGCKCHYCGKCFSRPWLLQGHIRTHTGEKPFKCTICDKAFADKSNLRAHIQTHSNTKPHICSRCGKAFALKSYLYKHEESSCIRVHHQQQRIIDKSEISSSFIPSNKYLTGQTSKTLNTAFEHATTSSTSVIVPPRNSQNLKPLKVERDLPNSFISAIIRHARTTSDTIDNDLISEGVTCKAKNMIAYDAQHNNRLLSRVVIRTSVISSNPEHLVKYSGKKMSYDHVQQQSQEAFQAFSFNDANRLKDFSKHQSMTLSVAIA